MFVIPQVGKLIQRAALWTQVITAVVVFVVLLAFAFLSYQNAQRTLQLRQDQVVDQKIIGVTNAVSDRMDENGNMARAGAAFFDGSEAVTSDEWQRFFAKFKVESRYDGITSIGYTPLITQADVPAFLQTLQSQGVSPKVYPANNGPELAPVMYIQTYRGVTGSYGFDMYTSVERKAGMERARDSGKVALTDTVLLASTNQLGAVIYAPIYTRGVPIDTVEQRHAAVRGYAFVGVRIERLLANVLSEQDKESFGVVISEVTPGVLPKKIYSNLDNAKNLKQVKSSDTELYGKKWRITLYANDTIVSKTDADRPATILMGGIAISLIASLAVYLLIQYRTRSFALAEEHRLQQAKDELLSLASHQLRTPATGVKQYVGMVMEGFSGDITDEQAELLQQAYKSNERQLQIINEFLYVAKLGSGSLTTSVHRFDVVPLVKDLVQEMQNEVQERDHTIVVKTPASAFVHSDEHSLRMIVENLISNAVKYTQKGGKIHVTLQKEGDYVTIAVADNGIGIAKKDMDMLFKQFSRIPNELSSEVNGSGIGLYLAQQLAERNQGIIEVQSEEGKGSTFTLRLPQKSVKKITHNQK